MKFFSAYVVANKTAYNLFRRIETYENLSKKPKHEKRKREKEKESESVGM